MNALLDSLSKTVGRLGAPFEDLLNPILVKEVRQSLRGRFFMVMFWLTLLAATLVASIMLLLEGGDPSDTAGVYFFYAIFFCLSFAVHLFVPLSAYLSLGGEWDENTHDLLVLSSLRPGQIVLGKLLSAGVQVLLYYAASGPFLVFAFLLPGLDLVAAAWALGTTLLTSLALSSFALALSSISSVKLVRYILLAFMTWGLVSLGVWLTMPWVFFLRDPGSVHGPFFLPAILGTHCGLLIIAAFSVAFAAARFAHPEENRSSALRILTTVVILVGLGWAYYHTRSLGFLEVLLTYGLSLCGLLLFMGTFFLSEDERLGRRVRLQVPRSGLLGMLLAPWYPGGGRGVLFLLFHLVLVLVGIRVIANLESGAVALEVEQWWTLCLAGALYTFIYSALPTLLFSRFTRRLAFRIAARLAVPAVAVGSVLVPALFGFLIDVEFLWQGEFLANPGWLVMLLFKDESIAGPVGSLAAVAGVVLLLNLWRVGKGQLEMASCSVQRREAEARLVAMRAERGRPVGAEGSDALTGS